MYFFFRYWVQIFFHIAKKLKINGKENLPKEKGGFIIACNHIRYADPPIIAAVVKAKFAFMAKSDLFKNKLFAWLIRTCGAFPVVRGGKDDAAITTSVEKLKEGRALVIFPEGTRTKTGELGRGKSGVVIIASKANVPVLPMCLHYVGKRTVYVEIGKMIPPEQLAMQSNDRQELRRVTNIIMDNIKALQDTIYERIQKGE
jgi:1-acyl-sn-glycerol-3-phosphate acyltransferase